MITVLIFPSSYQKLVTTASPTQTTQEGNQKDLRLLATSSPSSYDKQTSISLFAWPIQEKRLFKNLKILFEFFKSYKLRKPRNFVPITWSIWQGPRISGESTRCQNRNWRQGWRSNKLLKPRNFVPITWSIWQGPRISGEIEFSRRCNALNKTDLLGSQGSLCCIILLTVNSKLPS